MPLAQLIGFISTNMHVIKALKPGAYTPFIFNFYVKFFTNN